jgi:hypothetical protein
LKEEIGLDFSVATSNVNTENIDKNEKNEYKNIIGENKLFLTNEIFQNFLKNSSMTQNAKMNILKNEKNKLNGNNDNDDTNSIEYLGQTIIETSYNHCIVDVYTVICNKKYRENIVFQDGEICWGEYIYVYLFIHIYIDVYIYIQMYTYIFIYTYIYTYIYIYIYIYE